MSAEVGEVEDGREWLRRRLELRPTNYPDTGRRGSHPDQRTCPPWCYIGRTSVGDHEMLSTNPMTARHILEHDPAIPLAFYNGSTLHGSLETARLLVDLSQRGQGSALVTLRPMFYDSEGHHMHREDRLRQLKLSVREAREVARALTWVADVSEGKELPPPLFPED